MASGACAAPSTSPSRDCVWCEPLLPGVFYTGAVRGGTRVPHGRGTLVSRGVRVDGWWDDGDVFCCSLKIGTRVTLANMHAGDTAGWVASLHRDAAAGRVHVWVGDHQAGAPNGTGTRVVVHDRTARAQECSIGLWCGGQLVSGSHTTASADARGNGCGVFAVAREWTAVWEALGVPHAEAPLGDTLRQRLPCHFLPLGTQSLARALRGMEGDHSGAWIGARDVAPRGHVPTFVYAFEASGTLLSIVPGVDADDERAVQVARAAVEKALGAVPFAFDVAVFLGAPGAYRALWQRGARGVPRDTTLWECECGSVQLAPRCAGCGSATKRTYAGALARANVFSRPLL